MTRRRRTARQRSAAEWTIRVMLATLAAALGYVSVTNALGHVLRADRPELAHMLAAGDGRITAALARKLSATPAIVADRAQAELLARKALRQDPTAVAAVSVLGVSALTRGDVPAARRLLAYAERLSRRDLQTTLWGIEDAVARGDVAGALRRYDIALRTARQASALLFPVLNTAVTDPAVRAELARTLAGQPGWGGVFIDHVATNSSDVPAVADLFGRLRKAGVPVPESADATLISALATRTSMDAAWTFYASTRRGVKRHRLRDPDFTAGPTTPSWFDWVSLNDAGVVTSIRRDGGGLFDFSAPATVGGPLLRQVQLLPSGRYLLQGRSIGIDQLEGSLPFWSLTCSDGRELGRVVVSNSAQSNGIFTGFLTVPTECPVQTLTLVARPSDAVTGVEGQIDWVRLCRPGDLKEASLCAPATPR